MHGRPMVSSASRPRSNRDGCDQSVRNIRAALAFPTSMETVAPGTLATEPRPVVPVLPMSQEALYWTLQAIGWTGFGLLMFLWGMTHLSPGFALLNKAILVSLGVLSTIGMRSLFRTVRRLQWTARRVVTISLGTSALLAVAWSELHLVVWDASQAIIHNRSWSVGWIDLYPGTVLTNFLVLTAWTLGYFGMHSWMALDLERERTRVAERQAHQARLSALQSQLEPHFLFNSLNAVSTLVAEHRNAEAQTMLSRLSDFLRRTLDTAATPEVTVAEETDLARQYIAIQTVRFGDRLQVRFEIDPLTCDAVVPVLILQPIIENAVIHGALARERGGSIDIRVLREGDRLRLTVDDDGPGPASRRGNGHGLENASSRLVELYGNDHEFRLAARPEGGTSATVLIPFRLSAGVRPTVTTGAIA